MDPKLVIAGYACTETILHVTALPDLGGRVTEDKYLSRPGGRAGNAAIAAARLGATASLCAMLGDDAEGRRLFNFYADNRVEVQYLKFSHEKRTGIEYLLHETYCDASRRLVYPGAAEDLTLGQISSALNAFPAGLYLTTELPFELVNQAARMSNAKGVPVFIDALPVNSRMPWEQLPPVELFIIDRTAAETVAMCGKINVENCLRAAVAISKRVQAKYYVIRLPGQGFFVYDGKYHNIIAPDGVLTTPGKTVCPVDTEGAALAASYILTGDIRRACTIAAIGSRLARENRGISIASREQILDYCRTNDLTLKK